MLTVCSYISIKENVAPWHLHFLSSKQLQACQGHVKGPCQDQQTTTEYNRALHSGSTSRDLRMDDGCSQQMSRKNSSFNSGAAEAHSETPGFQMGKSKESCRSPRTLTATPEKALRESQHFVLKQNGMKDDIM